MEELLLFFKKKKKHKKRIKILKTYIDFAIDAKLDIMERLKRM